MTLELIFIFKNGIYYVLLTNFSWLQLIEFLSNTNKCDKFNFTLTEQLLTPYVSKEIFVTFSGCNEI